MTAEHITAEPAAKGASASPHVGCASLKWLTNERKWSILMTDKKDTADMDVVAAGRGIYAKLQSRLKATDMGSFVVIDAVPATTRLIPAPSLPSAV